MALIQKLKTLTSSQFARIANVAGFRNNFSGISSTLQPDHGIDPLADNNGRLITRSADQYGYTDMGNLNGGLNNLGFISSGQSGYVDSITFGVIFGHTETCFLLQAFGFNSDPAVTYWVQLLVGTAASWVTGKKPAISIIVPPETNFNLIPTPSPSGLMVATNEFSRQINAITLDDTARIAISSTGDVYTSLPALTDPFFLHVAFRTLTVLP